MHFGEALSEERFVGAIRHAYESGIRTFMTADTYGQGQADTILGDALLSYPRESYCLIGAVGHDFYDGQRAGSKGFPRFTDASLRPPEEYGDYLKRATRLWRPSGRSVAGGPATVRKGLPIERFGTGLLLLGRGRRGAG